MKEKSVAFCFLQLKAKEKATFSKIIEGGFYVKNLGLFFQSLCLLTPLPAEAIAME